MGISVYGVSATHQAAGLASRYWKGSFPWSFLGPLQVESTQFMLEVSRRIGGRAVLIPTSDVTAMFVAENADELRENFIFPAQSAEVLESLINKKQMYQLAGAAHIPTAKTIFPQSQADVERFSQEAAFPVIVKGVDPRLPGGTTKTLLGRPEHLLEYYDTVVNSAEPNLLVQEYIPGEDDTVWMFNGYVNQRSTCLAAFTGQKLRQYPPYAGVASLGICLRNDAVGQMTSRFLDSVGYCGPVDVDYRYDGRDGSYKLLDVNPRIGATFRLFVAENGMDVARVYYLDMTDQPVPSIVPREGRKWMLEEDVRSCLRYRRDGKLSLRAWASSLRGVQETAWFALDDPAPFLTRCWGGLKSTFHPRTRLAGELPADVQGVPGTHEQTRPS